PDDVRVLRRFGDGIDRRVHLGGGVINGDAAGLFLLLLFRVVGRQIGGDAIPGLSVVARAEEELRADIDHAALRRAQMNRRVPVVAELAFFVTGQGLDVA